MKCPKCGKVSGIDLPLCPHCGHEIPSAVKPSSQDSAKPKERSKGGLIATGVMAFLCVAALIVNGFEVAIFIGYLLGTLALLWRSYRPPLKWWQGILVWLGGDVMGMAFSVFLAPPTFEERVLGSAEVLPAKLGTFALFLVVGIVLVTLGSWRRKAK